MDMIGRLEGFDQPVEGFRALVGRVVLIMDPPGWGVGDENIEITSIMDLIP
jgi:hypothetical protein